MSWPLLIRIAHDLALAIQYLHNQTPQLVHGNIEKANILVNSFFLSFFLYVKICN